jgi:hypothetical protein
MIYIPTFIKVGSGNGKVIRRDTDADTQTDSKVISSACFYFSQNKESILKNKLKSPGRERL